MYKVQVTKYEVRVKDYGVILIKAPICLKADWRQNISLELFEFNDGLIGGHNVVDVDQHTLHGAGHR